MVKDFIVQAEVILLYSFKGLRVSESDFLFLLKANLLLEERAWNVRRIIVPVDHIDTSGFIFVHLCSFFAQRIDLSFRKLIRLFIFRRKIWKEAYSGP